VTVGARTGILPAKEDRHDPLPHLLPRSPWGVTLRNRSLMGSMHTGLEETGDWGRVAAFYAARARGGAGLIVTGGMAPNREGGVFPGAAGLFSDSRHRQPPPRDRRRPCQGGHIAMQILHAGRYAYGKDCVAPSAVKSPISPFAPQELDEAGSKSRSPTSPPPPPAPWRRAMTGSR
jgi:2,4-dienoyl-CoA reductase (NADPH2)